MNDSENTTKFKTEVKTEVCVNNNLDQDLNSAAKHIQIGKRFDITIFKFTEENVLVPEELPSFEELLTQMKSIVCALTKNDLITGIKLCRSKASYSLYHRHVLGAVFGVTAAFTSDPQIIKLAVKEVNETVKYLNKKRKSSIKDYIIAPDYNTWTDEQVHAELCFSEMNIILAFLSLLGDRSFYSLLKASMKMRYSYGCLKECLNIIKQKTNWESEFSRIHFEAGIGLMIGVFDITISFFPTKFIQFLEFVGFSANCKLGLDLLKKSYKLRDTIRFPFITLFLCSYHTIFEFIFRLGEPDYELMRSIAKDCEKKFANSFYDHLIKGMQYAIESNLEAAHLNLQKCLELPVLSSHIQKIICFQLSIIKSAFGEWQSAAYYAKNLQEYKASPALFTYVYALYLFMDYDLNGNKSLEPEIKKLLKKTIELKKTYGGRLAFHEKLVNKRAQMHCEDLSNFLLPLFEIFYIYNVIKFGKNCKKVIDKYQEIVDKKLLTHSDKPDDYYTLIFYKAIFSNFQKNRKESFKFLNDVIKNQKKIKNEIHIVPQAYFEMARLYIDKKDYEKAELNLNKTKKYKNYLTESMITFRVKLSFDQIKNSQETKSLKIEEIYL